MTSLAPVPARYASTRDALHRLAVYVVSPWHEARTSRIGLRPVPGGFGTPSAAGNDDRVRVGSEGLTFDGPPPATYPFTTLRAAAGVAGLTMDASRSERLDVPPIGDVDGPLGIDPASVAFLGDWFAFGATLLGELLADSAPFEEPSEIQLWPEHFDVATEIGAGPARAGYGASPGDAAHPLPYVYAVPWTAPLEGDTFWNEPHFRGRSLGYAELCVVSDPHARAAEFLAECRARVAADHGGTP